MNLSELINEIVSDWAYRVNDGMPNPKNPMHVKELEIVLNEMGLGHVKSEILKSINEAEAGGFTNPALNKKVRYKNANGEDKEGIVGNLLRQPEDSPGRKAAEATLPPEGSPERETMNQELGSEKDGKAKPPEDAKGKEGEDGKEGGADAEAEKKKKAAAMFDPKADPAMGARMDREKAANDKLAQKDKEDAEGEKATPETPANQKTNKELAKAAGFDNVGSWYNDLNKKAMSDDGEVSSQAQKDLDTYEKNKEKDASAAKTGPEAGPNVEPPMDEPSRPDTTPVPDQDVPDANSPNDTEVPPVEKIEDTKIEIQKAQNRLKALERMKQDNPEQFVTPEKKAEWAKNKEILASKKQELADLESQQKFDAEKKKKAVEPLATELKNRKTSDGEDLDVDTTPNGSLIIGVEHGDGLESTKQTIEQVQKLPKDTKVMFVGEGGMTKDKDGNIELGGEQAEIRDAVKGHFDNAEESSWDENANVYDDSSPVYKEIEKELGSPSKARASVWSNMVGQGDDMNPDDYLDDEGKQWIIDQAKKAGATNITDKTDFNNLTDAERKDLYELNFNDEGKMGDNEIMKGQEAYNGFRQKELDRKIKEAEDNGYTVIAPVGNSHVDMRRQRMKSQQKPEQQPTDTKPEDKPEEQPKKEPSSEPKTPPKATKDDIKNEKPGKEAKTDSGGSLYSVGGGYYSDKPNGPAKYVRTESVIEMAFDDSLNEDVFALFEKSITGTLQNGEKITVQELPPRAVKKATQRAKAAAASSKEEPTQPTSTSTEKPAEQPKAGDFNPINADDVKKEMPKANTDTFGSKPDIPDEIDPKDLEQFNTDIEKVGKQISDAKERGEKAPNINLCDVTVPGTNLYCDDNLGIPRAAMPQFKGKPQPGTPAADMPVDKNGEVDTEPLFKKMLEEKGIKVVQTEVAADKLKATQSELVADKVIGMMNTLENDPTNESLTAPIYVSRDGYVIDGHHRWAAITAYNAKHPDNQIPMKVQAIDMDVKEAIPMCNDFAEQQGVAAKKADANQESDIQNVTSLPEPKPEDPEEKKNWFQKQKERIQQKFKVMKEAGKQFFGRGGHKPGSVPRRSFGQALVDKIKGIPKAVKDGIIHHAVMFKDASVAIFEAGVHGGLGTIEDPETGERFNHDDHIAVDENGKKRYEKIPQYETDSHGHVINDPETGKPMQKRHWLTGNLMNEDRPIPKEDMSDKQKELFYKSYQKEKKQIKAIVGTGKAIMITAAGAYGLSAAMGHAYTTAGQLMTSTAIELVPHTIVEGVVLGTGKAALYAGAVEMNHKKKLEEFSTNLVKTIGEYISSDKEIPADVLANSMELYNNIDKLRENMDKIPDDEGFLKDYVELHDQIEKDGNPKKEMKIESLIKEIISEIRLEEAKPKQDDLDVNYIDAKGKSHTIKFASAVKYDDKHPAYIAAMKLKDKGSKSTDEPNIQGTGLFDDPEYQQRMGAEPPPPAAKSSDSEENPEGLYDPNDELQSAVVDAKNSKELFSALDDLGEDEKDIMLDKVKAGAGGPVASTGETLCTEAQTNIIQGRYNPKEIRSSNEYKAELSNVKNVMNGTDKRAKTSLTKELGNICDKMGYYKEDGNPDYELAMAMKAEADLYIKQNLPEFKKTNVAKTKFKKEEDMVSWMTASFYSSYSLVNNGPADWDKKKGNGRVMKANPRTQGATKQVLLDGLKNAKTPEEKAHYENQLKVYNKFKGYHDTFLVYKNDKGHISVYHISNKKSDELDDPQNNTTPETRLANYQAAAREANLSPKAAKLVDKAQTTAMAGSADNDNIAKSTYTEIPEEDINLIASLSNRLPARGQTDVKDEYYKDLKDDSIIKKYYKKQYGDKWEAKLKSAKPNEIIGVAMEIAKNTDDISKLSGNFTKFVLKQGQLAQSIFAKSQSGMNAKQISESFNGIYSPKEIQAILNNDTMKMLADKKAQHAAGLEGVHKGFITSLHKADGTKTGHSGKNGPAIETYVAGTLKALHIDTYVTNYDDSVQIEMGGVGCTPVDVRGCMANLSGFKGDTTTPEGRASLNKYLAENVKVDADSDAVYLMGSDGKTRTYLASDTWRQAGSSKKIATGFGSNLRKCLKKAVGTRLSKKKNNK